MLTTKTNLHFEKGFTLIELVSFMVVISIALTGTLMVYRELLSRSANPAIAQQLLLLSQTQLDMILARPYDENTLPGRVPACGDGSACAGIGLDGGETLSALQSLDDVDDFNGYRDNPLPGYQREVVVSFAGNRFSLANDQVKFIEVTSRGPQGSVLKLSAYRANF